MTVGHDGFRDAEFQTIGAEARIHPLHLEILGFRLFLDNSTLPRIITMATDWPAYARLWTVALAGHRGLLHYHPGHHQPNQPMTVRMT